MPRKMFCFHAFSSLFIALIAFAAVKVVSYAENKTNAAAAEPVAATGHAVPRTTRGPAIYLTEPGRLAVTPSSEQSILEALANGPAQPVALASADLDADGVQDWVAGYSNGENGIIAIRRGNLDAFAPQSEESFDAIGRGDFPSPFLPDARAIAIPVHPDFVAEGSFNPYGYRDLIVAGRGGHSIYLLSNDGKGNFSTPRAIEVGGPITALVVGDFGDSRAFSKLLVGICDERGSSLRVYEGAVNGLGPRTTIALNGPATNLVLDDLGEAERSAVFISNRKVVILHSSSMKLEKVELQNNVTSFAMGSFIHDRNGGGQIALLRPNGSIDIAAHNQFDPRMSTDDGMTAARKEGLNQRSHIAISARTRAKRSWKIVEHVPMVASAGAVQESVLLRTRISDHVTDDIMVLDPSMGQMVLVSHPDPAPGASSFLPARISTRPYSGSPVATMAVRTNIDGRPGVVALHRGEVAPVVMMPLPDPTFFVNRTDDPAPGVVANTCNNVSNADTSTSCSLREAVRKANATAGTDTIMLAAGTYTLSIPRNSADHHTALTGALYIQDSVNVVGAGQASTIVQGGSTSANGVDMVFAVNEDIDSITSATASFSNLTIKFGRNRGSVAGFDGDGGGMEFDTGTGGTANLTLTNVTFDSNSTLDGNGGGLAAFNASSGLAAGGPGSVTVNNCIFTNNSVKEVNVGATGSGGGIMVFDLMHILINSGTSITNNTATGTGGGIEIFSAGSGSRQSVIHGTTVSGNSATGEGGGIDSRANLLIDTGSLISNNTSGTDGGGISSNVTGTDTVALSKVTITGNTAAHGGGFGAESTGLNTIHFSRLAGNTATTAGTNLHNASGATISATNNWWGTNTPANTINNTSGTTTFDPFIELTYTASPAVIRINQSTTLTGDMSKDNHGNGAALLGNLDRIVGLPVTFDNPVLGTIPQAQPETLNASAQATATFNAGGTSGRGSANATVDQAVIGANSNLVASATEAGTTATITTVGVHNFAANETVVMTGVGIAGYNGTFTILSTPTPTTFTFAAAAGLASSSGGNAKVGIIILQPPQITKSFGAASIPIGGTTTVSFSMNNPNVVAINSGFTDTLPTGLQVASTPGVVNNCGGSVTANAASGSISFSNNLTPIGVCTITVNITGTVDNSYANSVSILSTDAGNGNTSSASLTVINPPHIAKAFGTSPIVFGQTTSLTFTLDSNSNQNLTITGAGFTDSLPAGMIISTPNGASTTCAGASVTAVAGSSTVTFAGASIPPTPSCTVTVNVTGVSVGSLTNSVSVSSTNAGTGNTASATLVVNKANTTVAVQTSGSPSVFGQSVTFTATISVTSPGSGTPTGNVTFKDNGVNIGTCAAQTVSAGSATCSITTLGVASHPITAVYNGDSNFNASPASPTTTQVVNKADTTTNITSDNPDASVVNQAVTIQFSVGANNPGSGTPTGNVTVTDGVNSCTATNAVGQCTITYATPGPRTLTATYVGDMNYNASPVSSGASHTVNQANTTAAVTSDSPDPTVAGQAVAVSYTVTGSSGNSPTSPTGNVTISDGVDSCTATVAAGTCNVTLTTAGARTLTATYAGDTNFNASPASAGASHTVSNTAVWNGSTSSNWNTPANWTTNFVPISTNDVSLPAAGVTNQPNLSAQDTTVNNLTVASGRSLTISGAHKLTINGVLTMNGNNIDDTAGSLELGNGATITRTSGTILGSLKKDFLNGLLTEGAEDAAAPDAPTVTTFTYPVGTAAGMFEVQVTPTATSNGSLTIQNFDGNPAPTAAASTLQRYWTTSSTGSIQADVKFNFHATPTGNPPGSAAGYTELRVVGGVVQSFPNGAPCPGAGSPCFDNTAKTIFVAGVTSFNANWTAGVPLGTTAAHVAVSGRVFSAEGIALRGARVILDDGTGHPMSVVTNAFGYYHFDAVQSGGTYMLNASARGRTFTPRVVTVNDELTGVNLEALP